MADGAVVEDHEAPCEALATDREGQFPMSDHVDSREMFSLRPPLA